METQIVSTLFPAFCASALSQRKGKNLKGNVLDQIISGLL
jgi:hypothetical protein